MEGSGVRTYGADLSTVNITEGIGDSTTPRVTLPWTSLPPCGNGSSGEKDAPYKDFYHQAQYATGMVIYPIICIYGVVGCIVILIVFSRKSMQTSTNVYLSALAVSDLIKLINDLLYFLTVLFMNIDQPTGQRMFAYLYPYAHIVMNMPVFVSSWLTVCVAAERYILVCHPTYARSIITVARARAVSTACFIIMTLIAIPCALRYRTVHCVMVLGGQNVSVPDIELTPLWRNKTFELAYNWVQSLIRSIIPLIILILLNAFIINALRKTRANRRLASRNKITLMLIMVIIFFSVCITPDAVLSAFFNHGYADSGDYLVRGVREITDTLLALNASINFTLYIIFNKIFRDQFVLLFCGRCCKHLQEQQEDQTYRRLSEGRTHGTQMNGHSQPAKQMKDSKEQTFV